MCALELSIENLSKLKPPYILLDTIKKDNENKKSLLFSNIVEVLEFRHNDSPDPFFKKIENYLRKGFWLAGYFCYEFGYYLEDAFESFRQKNKMPLAWFVVTAAPEQIEIKNNFSTANKCFSLAGLKANTTKNQYKKAIDKIKYFLKEGFSYQVNYTFKIKFDFKGDPLELYGYLRNRQPTPYAALIKTDDKNYFLSFSPELFIRMDKNKIITRPMKGTVSRGNDSNKDKRKEKQLAKSRKIQSENVMITDLLRNDLGRISKKVRVPKLFSVERYKTLYQMTSTVEAKLDRQKSLKEIFSSLFPCGSVTGAPKIKTMQIIKNLEKEERGIYTGAIGYICPEKKSCFSVAIRTAHIQAGKGEFGTGGGILYGSKKGSEYKEALLKADFFTQPKVYFRLIETIFWSKKGFWLLDLHLRRLKRSCRYFSVPFFEEKIKEELVKKVKRRKKETKLRLLIDLKGKVSVSAKKLKKIALPVKAKINSKRVDPSDKFLYHKTTKRSLYERERKKANEEGFFETIFLNTKGELTEGAISNIFLKQEGKLFTPPVSCGLLPGVLRQHLLGQKKASQKKLYLKDIREADKIYLGNSVRGLLEAKI